MIVRMFLNRVARYEPERMKKTWKAPWGIPSAVVRRELSTRPLMMSFPNCYQLSALLLLVDWSIAHLQNLH